MPWDQIVGWATLAAVVVAWWWGKRAARNKANRIRSEAYAQARVDLGISQTVTVVGDDRRAVHAYGTAHDHYAADDGAADDRAAVDGRGVRGVVHDGYGRCELVTGWPRPVVGDRDAPHRVPGAAGPSLGPGWSDADG